MQTSIGITFNSGLLIAFLIMIKILMEHDILRHC